MVLFYVDDIITLCRNIDLLKLRAFKSNLTATYEMKDIGDLNWFLGIRVVCDQSQCKLWLCQDSYISRLATTFYLEDIKLLSIPMTTDDLLPYGDTASPQEAYAYQCRVSFLLYAAMITWSDIACMAAKLSESLRNPSPHHLAAVDRAIAYLNGMKNLAIEYSDTANHSQVFTCASDTAFADDTSTRYSTEGYLF